MDVVCEVRGVGASFNEERGRCENKRNEQRERRESKRGEEGKEKQDRTGSRTKKGVRLCLTSGLKFHVYVYKCYIWCVLIHYRQNEL